MPARTEDGLRKGKRMVTIIVALTLSTLFLIWCYAMLLSGHDCEGEDCDFCPYQGQCTRMIQKMMKGKKK